jgi:hypothetical protein
MQEYRNTAGVVNQQLPFHASREPGVQPVIRFGEVWSLIFVKPIVMLDPDLFVMIKSKGVPG